MIRRLNRRRRLWSLLGAALLLLYLAYLVGANLFLGSDWLQQRVAAASARHEVTWDSLSSWFPGYLHGSGLRVRSATGRVQSLVVVERFSASIRWFDRGDRSLNLGSLWLSGLTAEIRPLSMLRRANPAEREFFPVIPGVPPSSPDWPDVAGPERPAWNLTVGEMEVEGRSDVSLGNYRIGLSGMLSGTVSYGAGHELAIDGAQVSWEGLRIAVNDGEVLREGRVAGGFSMRPHVARFHPGIAKLAFYSADVDIDAHLANLEVLNFYLGAGERADWPGFEASGRLGGRLQLEQGTLGPDTALEVESEAIRFGTELFDLASAGRILLQPQRRSDRDGWRLLRVSVGDFALDHRTLGQRLLEIDSLEVELSARDAAVWRRLEDPELLASMARSEVPDLTLLNRLIPEKTRARVVAGAGNLAARFEWRRGVTDGVLRVDAEGVGLEVRDQQFHSDLDLELVVKADQDNQELSVSGTRLSISDLRSLPDGADDGQTWQGEMTIDEGSVRLRQRVDVAAARREGIDSLVEFADGRLSLQGSVSDIGFLNRLLTRDGRLRLRGAGRLNADFSMVEGIIGVGSRVQYRSEDAGAHFLDFEARGRGVLSAEFVARGAERWLQATTELSDVKLVRDDQELPFIESPLVAFGLSGRMPDVSEPPQGLKVTLEMPSARVPDITVYNEYLPPDGSIRLTSGSGRLRSRIALGEESATGELVLEAPGVGAVVNGRDIVFDLEAALDLADGNPETRQFDIDGSYVGIDNLVAGEGVEVPEGWSTRFLFRDGRMVWGRPLRLDADTELTMSSTGPLVELLAGRFRYLKWLQDMLSVRDVVGNARITMVPDALLIDDLELRGEDIEVLARLKLAQGGARGVVYNRLGRLAATVEFDGDDRDWHILSARRKFDAYRGP